MIRQQFLITRFNLPQFKTNTKIDYECDNDYLNYRFNLFENYTFPSVMSQTRKDFIWIVMFSNRLPDQFRSVIEKYQYIMPEFHPVYLDKSDVAPAPVVSNTFSNIIKEMAKEERALITRLDNDDIISKYYIEAIYKAAAEQSISGAYAIYFDRGLQYDLNRKVMCNWVKSNNHFYTIDTPINDECIYTPLSIDHEKVFEVMKVVNVSDGKPMWMEIVHGGNLSNQCRLTLDKRISEPSQLDDFCINGNFNLCSDFKTNVIATEGSLRSIWKGFKYKLKGFINYR